MNDQLIIATVDVLSLPLVNRFYKHCRYSAKAGRGETVFVAKLGMRIVGAVRLISADDGYVFLRSMCIDPEWRRQGIGQQLLRGMLPFLDKVNCYCYPFSHLIDFYNQAGFVHVHETDVPLWVSAACERYRQQGRDIQIMLRHKMTESICIVS